MFVHALNTAGRYAHCIDLPVAHTQSGNLFSTTLKLKGRSCSSATWTATRSRASTRGR